MDYSVEKVDSYTHVHTSTRPNTKTAYALAERYCQNVEIN